MNNFHDCNQVENPPSNPEREPYFSALGYDHGVYFFLQHSSGRVVIIDMNKYSSTKALKQRMKVLAPETYWRAKYLPRPGASTWLRALDVLFRQCEAAGFYDPEAPRSAASSAGGVS